MFYLHLIYSMRIFSYREQLVLRFIQSTASYYHTLEMVFQRCDKGDFQARLITIHSLFFHSNAKLDIGKTNPFCNFCQNLCNF